MRLPSMRGGCGARGTGRCRRGGWLRDLTGRQRRLCRRASARAAPARPSAARTARSGCRGTAPRASRPAGPARSAARRRSGTLVVGEGQRQPVQLLAQLGREALLELLDRALVDLAQPGPRGVVERGGAHLLEQLLDHRADPHHLRGLLDHVGRAALLVTRGCRQHDLLAVTANEHDPAFVVLRLLGHPFILPSTLSTIFPTCDGRRHQLVRLGHLRPRQHPVDDGPHLARGDSRPDAGQDRRHDRGLLVLRPRAQRRRVHRAALAEQRSRG